MIARLLFAGLLACTQVFALQRPYSLEIDAPHAENEGPIRRLRTVADGDLTTLIPGHPEILTIYHLVRSAVDLHGDKECLGSRSVVTTHAEQKNVTKFINGVETQVPKTWIYQELSPYKYRSYRDLGTESLDIGAGLRKLGLRPSDKIAIYAETSAEWQVFAQGCVSQAFPIVTAYASLGKDGLTHSLNQTQAKAIFTDAALLGTLDTILPTLNDLQYVIYHGKPKDAVLEAFSKNEKIRNITSYDELVYLGKDNPIAPFPPRPNDIACIMYTSGSTGAPKGVVLTHQNVISAVAGVDSAIATDGSGRLKVDENDRFLCFLPLAHILEFVYELCAIHWGGTIGYGNPRTVTDDSVRNCRGDIQEFKPTVLVAVPAVWEKIKKKVDATLESKNIVIRGIFWAAFKLKAKLMDWGMSGGIVNPVFKNIRAATGGNVKLTVSGGSPLNKDTQRFLSITHAPLLVGYGLTESTAMAALSTPETLEFGAVGVPTSSIEIKLVDALEMGYVHTNEPSQGEIWLRGPTIAKGYYMNENETAKAFTSDGWFKTGDVGQWNPSGTLTIIDRVKNLVKTLNGEYIALEKVESAYRTARMVDNVCVFAFPDKIKPIAVVVPEQSALRAFLEKSKVANKHADLAELAGNDKVKDAVLKDMLSAAKAAGLQGIELVSGIVLAHEAWIPQNGLVTAAMKLSRRNIEKVYANEIKQLLATTQ